MNIDPIILAYKKLIPSLIATPVPPVLAEQHLSLINGLSSVLFVSQGLRVSDKDPMQAMIALGTYATARKILKDALVSIKNYFVQNSIVFGAGEPGASLYTITNTSI